MKLAFLTVLAFLTAAACAHRGNYSEEMKITGRKTLSQTHGAKAAERTGDHKDSKYFSTMDFYNLKPSDTLAILPKFKTLQQSSEWSCGPASVMMVLEYFGKLDDYDELSLAKLRPQKEKPGPTDLKDMVRIFNAVGGFEIITRFDGGAEIDETKKLAALENFIKSGYPVLVLWNAFGAHWQVIIGYDNMGTQTTADDVIILADPYDTTDHNQDGYTVYSAERFVYGWTTGRFFGNNPQDNDFQFAAVKPIKSNP